jgi:hypothetical protein
VNTTLYHKAFILVPGSATKKTYSSVFFRIPKYHKHHS